MVNKRKEGAAYEEAAVEYLCAHGFCVLERNFYMRGGELDIIAREDDYIVFVEVRHRSESGGGHMSALASVNLGKQRHICRTAAFYLKKNGLYDVAQVRFDVISVGEDGSVKHIKNAFEYKV